MPIAIVGMGMRLPGNCHDSEAFWDLLINQREGMIDIPSSRWNSEGFYDQHGRPGTTKVNKGNFLGSIDPADFDGSFFSMSAAQIAKVDPQHRILLETTYEALENAGERNFRGKKVGVYVGMFADDFVEMQSKDSEPHEFLSLTGHLDLFGSMLCPQNLLDSKLTKFQAIVFRTNLIGLGLGTSPPPSHV